MSNKDIFLLNGRHPLYFNLNVIYVYDIKLIKLQRYSPTWQYSGIYKLQEYSTSTCLYIMVFHIFSILEKLESQRKYFRMRHIISQHLITYTSIDNLNRGAHQQFEQNIYSVMSYRQTLHNYFSILIQYLISLK